MNYICITGPSRGLGKAIAELLIENESAFVTGIGRTHTIEHPRYKARIADLANANDVKDITFSYPAHAETIILINNAGTLGEIGQIGQLHNQTLEQSLYLNLSAPCLLMNRFLLDSRAFKGNRIILNISSGASQNAYDGWGMYCATKAGLDMFSLTAIEEAKIRGDEKTFIYSIAPGIIDTDMQTQIRATNSSQFSQVDRFVTLHRENQLSSPDDVAQKLKHILFHFEQIPSGRYDLRELNL